jgi:hypothetical protein
MSLTFQQKHSLENGSVVLYHEGKLQSGDDFHVLIAVPSKNIQAYFSYIATKADFAVSELENYGYILHCDIGIMSDEDLDKCIHQFVV